MGAGEFAIDTNVIITIEDDTENAAADVNTSNTEIVTKYNLSMDNATGHDHDGSNSKSVSAGIGGLTMLEVLVGQIMGGYA